MSIEKMTMELIGLIESDDETKDISKIFGLATSIIQKLNYQIIDLVKLNDMLVTLNDLRSTFIFRLKEDIDFTNEEQEKLITKINELEMQYIIKCLTLTQDKNNE